MLTGALVALILTVWAAIGAASALVCFWVVNP
jgi:hypothetical protein